MTQLCIVKTQLSVKCKVTLEKFIYSQKFLIALELVVHSDYKKSLFLLINQTFRCYKVDILALKRIHLNDRLKIGARFWLFVIRNVIKLFFVPNRLRLINIATNLVIRIGGRYSKSMTSSLKTRNRYFLVNDEFGIEDVIIDFSMNREANR